MSSKDFVKGRSTVKKKSTPKSRESLDVLRIFLHIRDRFRGKQVDLQLLDDLLSSGDIDSEIDKVPVVFSLMMSLHAEAEERYANFKNDTEKYYAMLYQKTSESDDIVGRVTDPKIDAVIKQDPNYNTMLMTLNKYAKLRNLYKGAMSAFDMRANLLQTKSANVRAKAGGNT